MEIQNNNERQNMKQCPRCNTINSSDNTYCIGCGLLLSNETANTSHAQPTPKKKFIKWPFFLGGGITFFIILITIVSNSCFHEWQPANCDEPQICSKCFATKGEVAEHNWTDATCTLPQTCSSCGETNGEANGHSVSQWKTLSKSSCSKAGTKEGTCSICNEIVTEELPLSSHTNGKWEITKEPTTSSAGEKSLKCNVCKQVIKTKEFTLSADEIKKRYKEKCKNYSYNAISRNPGDYDGKHAVFTGEVIQVQQEELYGIMVYVLRVDVTWNGYYYDDTIYVTYYADENAPRILEDDIITMYGQLKGEKTYETVLGSSVTIPSFSAEYIDIK